MQGLKNSLYLERLARAAGIRLTKPGFPSNQNGHYQIHGKLLVNYYPDSAKKTAYVAGTKKGIQGVTPEMALEMSMREPDRVPDHMKDTRSRNSKAIRRKMFRGRETVPCCWCGEPITLETSTIEHKIPLDRGGLDNANNRVLACAPCNNKRGNNMPELSQKPNSEK